MKNYLLVMTNNTNIEEVKLRILESYSRWGVPSDFIEKNAVVKPETFIKILKLIEPKIPEMNCRVIPSSFDPNDPNLLAYPYKLDARWNSCERVLREFKARGVMMRLPLFYQTEALLHSACRNVGAFIFLNEPANMPVGSLAIRTAEIDTVVTDMTDAYLFSSYIKDNNLSLSKSWVIVHPISEIREVPEALMKEEINLVQEIHIFPGVPVFNQCQNLWAKKSKYFHLSDSFMNENTKDGFIITSTENEPLPLLRYRLPVHVNERGMCKCEKIIFEIKI